MTADHPRLGRGLGALIAPRPPRAVPADPAFAAAYREVPVGELEPNRRQPRTVFDDDALHDLVASIREVGLLQPIVVRELEPSRYEIVMGERRWRAAAAAELPVVPVLVRQTADDDMLRDALLENLHREQLNPLDEAAAYAQLLEDFGATHEQLARRVGRSRAHVTNTLRLLGLPPAVQRRVAAGVLSAGHARALLALDDPDARERLASRIVTEGLSVRSVEEIVALGSDLTRAGARAPRNRTRRDLSGVAGVLSDALETRVKVELGRTKGRVTVEFGSLDDLERILAAMAPGAVPALHAARAAGAD